MGRHNVPWRNRRGRKSSPAHESKPPPPARAGANQTLQRHVSFSETVELPPRSSNHSTAQINVNNTHSTSTSHAKDPEERKRDLVRKNSALRYLQRHGSVQALEEATIGFSDISSTDESDAASDTSTGKEVGPGELRRQLSSYGQAMFVESLSQESVDSNSTAVSSGTNGSSFSSASGSTASGSVSSDTARKREGFTRTKSELQKLIEARLASRSKSPEAKPHVENERQFHTPWELPSQQKVLFNYTARNIPKLNEASMSMQPKQGHFPARNYDAVFDKPKPNRLAAKKFSKGPEMFAQMTLSDVIW